MKVNKGFTLIELLAVIVILAIIALIATPTILGAIEKSKIGAAKASALNYVNAVENYIILSEIDSSKYPVKLENGKKYKISSDTTELSMLDYFVENVKAEENTEVFLNDIIDIKGEKPTGGWLEIKNSKVGDYSLKVNNYSVNYDSTTQKTEIIKNGEIQEPPAENVYKDGTAVYFNPEINEICDAEDAVSTTGTKTGCMKWYIFGDDNQTSIINMILDHNTTARVVWNSDTTQIESNEAKAVLQTDIETWSEDVKSTARFIEADEIAAITSANKEETIKWNSEKWENFNMTEDYEYLPVDIDSEISWFYLDGQGSTYEKSENGWRLATATALGASKYSWLYDNLSQCTSYGCNIEDNNKYPYYDDVDSTTSTTDGYWTNNPLKIGIDTTGENFNYVWVIERRGSLSKGYTTYKKMGIRPVITIDKEMLK